MVFLDSNHFDEVHRLNIPIWMLYNAQLSSCRCYIYAVGVNESGFMRHRNARRHYLTKLHIESGDVRAHEIESKCPAEPAAVLLCPASTSLVPSSLEQVRLFIGSDCIYCLGDIENNNGDQVSNSKSQDILA